MRTRSYNTPGQKTLVNNTVVNNIVINNTVVNNTHAPNKRHIAGFTLLELLTVTALIGVLASVALPVYRNYAVMARVTEGITLLGELRTRISVDYSENNALGSVIPAGGTPDGEVFGGPFYKYQTLFGVPHDMWDQIEYQPKGPNRVIALRAHRKPEWENTDIGIYLQVRLNSDSTLSFRCTINNDLTNEQYVPNSCRLGDVNDWLW